jgi:hypothetical protein
MNKPLSYSPGEARTYRQCGPNVRKLIIERTSQLALETPKLPGETPAGRFMAGLISGDLARNMREATTWVAEALGILRRAPGSDLWLVDDEAIAGEILKGIEERRFNEHHTTKVIPAA